MRLLEGAAVPEEGQIEEREGNGGRHLLIDMNVNRMDYAKIPK